MRLDTNMITHTCTKMEVWLLSAVIREEIRNCSVAGDNVAKNIVDMQRNSHHRAYGRGETVGEIAPEGLTVRGQSAEWRSYDRAEDELASIQKYTRTVIEIRVF